MLRFVCISFAILITATCALSQGKNNSLQGVPFKERIVTGGGFGLGFGSTQDYISLSPVVAYAVTKKVMTGTSFTFRYTNYKYYSPSVELIDYGLSPFVRFTFYRGIFVQTEYEYLNYEFPVDNLNTTRQQFRSFLAGGGIVQPLGDKAALYFMALYNFSYVNAGPGIYTPYDSPLIIRAGINIGGFLGF
jgi:hypothetical protein